ncbi:MAG: M20/M25/M40 family metallo-hydrolase, partial [Synergistaceae bacterium]
SIKGGTFRLAIPSYGDVTISVAADDIETLKSTAAECLDTFAKEYKATAPNLALTAEETERAEFAVSDTDLKKLLTVVTLSPNGISEMNGGVAGTVESSDNMGEIYMDGDKLVIVYEVRASFKSTQEYIVSKITALAAMVGAQYETFSGYPGWAFAPNSPLREAALGVYKELYGSDMTVTVVHAGLEVGCFIEGKPDLDAVSIGPNCWYFHSPSECTSVSSVCKTWEFLCALLAEGGHLPK